MPSVKNNTAVRDQLEVLIAVHITFCMRRHCTALAGMHACRQHKVMISRKHIVCTAARYCLQVWAC